MDEPASPQRVLLIDDGELSGLAALLEGMDVPFERLRGGLIDGSLGPPTDLLVATPRRAGTVRRGSPPGAAPGRPIRIIAADEDSKAMRRMLRRMGFHLLVRSSAHAEAWRLLVERALFQRDFEGGERREDPRLPVASGVTLSEDRSQSRATLLDISNRGCRLRTAQMMLPGRTVRVEIPVAEGAEPLTLDARLVRTLMEPAPEGGTRYTAGLLFDADLPEAQRERLGALLNDLSAGPGSLVTDESAGGPLPACESPSIPGLTFDAETDPAVRANVEIALHHEREGAPARPASERRRSPRSSFSGSVLASGGSAGEPGCVLMGCDISAGGMRVERIAGLSLGDRFDLVLYGPGRAEPYRLSAEVARDDGEAGLALHFLDVPRDTARGLEKLVACLPDIESLEEGEAAGMGAVISRIIARPEE